MHTRQYFHVLKELTTACQVFILAMSEITKIKTNIISQIPYAHLKDQVRIDIQLLSTKLYFHYFLRKN